jgi:hypothetical protein
MRLEDIKRRPHLCDALMKSSHNSVSRLRTDLKAPHAVWRNSFKPASFNGAGLTTHECTLGRLVASRSGQRKAGDVALRRAKFGRIDGLSVERQRIEARSISNCDLERRVACHSLHAASLDQA